MFEFRPGLIPSSRQGWWILVSDATSDEIEQAIHQDERIARDPENNLSALHWARWVGLHHAYVKALAREARHVHVNHDQGEDDE